MAQPTAQQGPYRPEPPTELEYMGRSELDDFVSDTGKEMALSPQEVEQLHLRRRRLSVERSQPQPQRHAMRGVNAEADGGRGGAPLKLMVLGDEGASGKIR
jgi:hypothetical protein